MNPDFRKMLQEAKVQVRRMKKYNPYLFPEYLELKNAEADLKLARERVERARAAWRKIGNS